MRIVGLVEKAKKSSAVKSEKRRKSKEKPEGGEQKNDGKGVL